ncbi:hypothetical protein VTI28DRAFT_10472 [Corynascus sepedonium]
MRDFLAIAHNLINQISCARGRRPSAKGLPASPRGPPQIFCFLVFCAFCSIFCCFRGGCQVPGGHDRTSSLDPDRCRELARLRDRFAVK